MKKIAIVIIVVAIIGIIAYVYLGREKEPVFKTEKAGRGDITETVTASGIVNPVNKVLVGTQVSGTIKNIYVDFNSVVKKGDPIADIDPAIFMAQLEQSRANLMQARANVEKAEASLANLKRVFERKGNLFSKEIIAKDELDAAESEYISAKAGLTAAKAQVAQAGAALKRDEINFRYTKILSPVDGIVISRDVNVGQTVAASFQTPTLFMIAEDLTKMQINTNVDEADISRVREGQDVEFTVDAYGEEVFNGKVTQIRIAPITVENVVTYDVIITLDNPELKLKPGMTANVSIVILTKKNVLRISNASLRFRLENKGAPAAFEKPGVWILEGKKPRRVHIESGITDGNFTEIAGGELREGHDVIVESSTNEKKTSNGGGSRRPPVHL